MGVVSVSVHTKAEKNSPHVHQCDESVELPDLGSAAYLNIQSVMEAARKANCDAVHPGYGFLAENPDFARACEKKGIRFVGPSSRAITLMGDKAAAKEVARKVNVPTVYSFPSFPIEREKTKLQFPLLLKPLAGGGGKGMVVVRSEREFNPAMERAKREAVASFGDDRILAEPYLEKTRHIEVQIMGDQSGGVVHLFERDCTLQRRHQKVVEESPSPSIDAQLRSALCEAAIRIAKEAKYENAGTVEFLVDSEDQFFFMEMNTRLQVEHPVTEMCTGIDLVRAQLGIAQGASVREALGEFKPKGHAVECRIYAENPEKGFLPSTGKVLLLQVADEEEVRIDSGITEGMEITPQFDPLLLKVIVHASSRAKALERMDRALAKTVLLGTQHNINFLRWLLGQKEVSLFRHDTQWIERHLPDYQKWEGGRDLTDLFSVVRHEEKKERICRSGGEKEDFWNEDPWLTIQDFRLGVAA